MSDRPDVHDTDFVDVQEGEFSEEFTNGELFHNWNDENGRKVPIAPYNNPDWRDKFVPNKDPDTWTDYKTAKDWAEKVPSYGVGKYIPSSDMEEVTSEYDLPEDDWPETRDEVLVDFDNCLDLDANEVVAEVAEWMHHFWTLTEISPSGTGYHSYGHGELPEDVAAIEVEMEAPDGWFTEGTDDDVHIEAYDGGRYTTVTGQALADFPSEPQDIQVPLDHLARLHKERGGSDSGGGEQREQKYEKEDLNGVDVVHDREAQMDYLAQLHPREMNLRSRLTEGDLNDDDRKSFDPSWEHSESGTRLGWDYNPSSTGWVYRKGNVGLSNAKVIALEERIINSERASMEGKWDQIVEAARDRGIAVPEYESPFEGGPAERVPFLGLKPLSELDQYEKRYIADHYGIDIPDVDEVREKTGELILENIREAGYKIINSPTGGGKSWFVATRDWLDDHAVTGGQPVVMFSATKQARDEQYQRSVDAGLETRKLRGREETCAMAAGEFDTGNDAGNEPITMYGKDLSDHINFCCSTLNHAYSSVHERIEEELGYAPCEPDEHECPSKTELEDALRDDDGSPQYDVIHACHPWMHVPSLRLHTNIVADEQMDFQASEDSGVMRESINQLVEWSDLPMDSYRELRRISQEGTISTGQVGLNGGPAGVKRFDAEDVIAPAVRNASDDVLAECVDLRTALNYGEGKDADMEDYEYHELLQIARSLTDYQLYKAADTDEFVRAALEDTPPRRWFYDHQVHSLAPAFARCLWNAEEASGGFLSARVDYKPPRLDAKAHDADAWNKITVRTIFNEDGPHKAWAKPDVSLARSFTALDATAQDDDPMWGLNGHEHMVTEKVLSDEERTMYRRHTRGLETAQVGTSLNAMTTDHHWDSIEDRLRACFNELREHYGDAWRSVVTSGACEDKVLELMDEAGIDEPLSITYGNEKSNEKMDGEPVGVVAGSIDPGDDMIIETLAALGLQASPVENDCERCGGTGEDDGEYCDSCEGTGTHRERGRTFEGPDADAAEKVLKSVREAHIRQSVGRWARDAEDPDDTATVFVFTNAAPEGLIDAKVPGAVWTASENQKEVLEAVKEASGAITSTEIAEQVSVTKASVNRTLKNARERGIIECYGGAGANGAYLYAAESGACVDGDADLGESTRNAYEDYSMWDVSIESYPDRAVDVDPPDRRDRPHQVSLSTYPAVTDPPS